MNATIKSDSHPGLKYLHSLEIWKGAGGFGLDKISSVLKVLGNPQDQVRSIHVTGTNGKGTTTVVTAAILASAGYRVGFNVSPHLFALNERIVVDGRHVEMSLIGEKGEELALASQKVGALLSFHEALTAISFMIFRDLALDWIVIEVGLGGRFDASNVIKRPEVSVITSIDLEHQHILGDTRPKIAFEKAGIIKEDSNTVIGPLDADSMAVVKQSAFHRNNRVFALHEDFDYISNHDDLINSDLDSFQFTSRGYAPIAVKKRIKGTHQLDNFSLALQTARIVGLPDSALINGALAAQWPGRLEVVNWNNRLILIDCAHNPHGMNALVNNLKRWSFSNLEVVFGVLNTKNWKEMLEQLVPLVSHFNLAMPNSEQALSLNLIEDYLSCLDISFSSFGRDLGSLLQSMVNGNGPLLITGSIYMIGEIRKMMGLTTNKYW
jgi:dihydrofolate synthase/folylpolyglutamate synthase